jgi:ABC-type uncharacterized transport system substrate-binding protein
MRRRGFIALLGGAAVWPLPAWTQAPPRKRVGVLIQGGPDYTALVGLRQGLGDAGLSEGAQIELVTRTTSGDLRDIAPAAKELENDGCIVIVAFSTSIARAARDGTARTPIVFTAGNDPVVFRLVDSVAKPGGRLTGVYYVLTEATPKRLEILEQLVPGLKRAVTFYNPSNSVAVLAFETARDEARRLGIELVGHEVRSPEEVRERVRRIKAGDADAYFFVADAMVHAQGELIIQKMTSLRMPAIAYELDLVEEGALAAYGANYRDLGRIAARYVASIFAGAHPGSLPVERVDRPTLAINLRTARELGLQVPSLLFIRADQVIE